MLFCDHISGVSSSFLLFSALWWCSLSKWLIELLAYASVHWCMYFKLVSCPSNQQLVQCFAHHPLLHSTWQQGDLRENTWLRGFGSNILAFGEEIWHGVRQIRFEFWLGYPPSLGTCLISQISLFNSEGHN